MKKLLSVFITLFIFASTLLCQNKPDSSQIANLKNLKEQVKANFAVDWDKELGTPDIITFSKPHQFDKNSAKSAKKFMKTIKGLLKSRDKIDSLYLIKSQEAEGNKYYKFKQMYKGIEVLGADYVLTVLQDGKMQSALGKFKKDIDIETIPTLSAEDAFKFAKNFPPNNIILADSLIESKLVIFSEKNKYQLAWEVKIPVEKNYENWTYYVSATNGKILSKISDVIYEYSSNLLIPQSELNAFPRHPGLDGSYTNYSPVAHSYENGYLRGTYAYIYNDGGSEAYNSNNDFSYSTSSSHFDEANLYYHIDKFRYNYIRYLGFSDFTQIKAHANHDFYYNGNPSPNATYSRSDHHLRFSNGQGVSGFNSLAREDKIIYHEYTHAITDYVADLYNTAYNGYNQTNSIHEGNSDYFAASYTGRTSIGDYAASSYTRSISNPDISNFSGYSDGTTEPHDGGEFWSACLWDIRNTSGIGQYYADRLIHKGLNALPATATFLQYRQAIIDWDNSYYSGNHVSKIIHAFYLRGIGTDNISISVSGPSYLSFKEKGTYTANISGGSSSRSYQWYLSSNGGSSWSQLGTAQTQQIGMVYSDYIIKCVVHDNQTGEEDSATKNIYYGNPLPKKNVAEENELIKPDSYALLANYPNPFNPTTTIDYQIKDDSFVSLKIYDVLGKEVTNLVNEYQNAGFYSIKFDGDNLSSGIYFYKISANGFTDIKKMLLNK